MLCKLNFLPPRFAAYLVAVLVAILVLSVTIHSSFAQVLPRFDPTGRSIFATPAQGGPFQQPGGASNTPVWRQPADPLPCAVPMQPSAIPIGQRDVPKLPDTLSPAPVVNNPKTLFRGRSGAIVVTPDQLVAPVGSEVILLGGICGPDGYLVTREPIEWVLSQESVGNLIDVSDAERSFLGHATGKSPRKLTGGFARGRTSERGFRLSRGTADPNDDVIAQQGQAWATVTSPSEGTTHVTVLAPNADGWDQRRKTATIHWIDATWQFPPSAVVQSGQTHPMTVRIKRPSDGSPVENWIVRYEIINSTIPAGFSPTGSGNAEVRTNSQGEATVNIRQETAETLPGKAQVRVQIIRPPFGNTTKSLPIAESISLIHWTAPALEITATGPENAGRDTVVNYRVEVKNPGDTPAHDVMVSAQIPEGMEFVSANPKATLYGDRVEWKLGDVPPRTVPYTMDVQMKTVRQGNMRTCFEAASVPDNLRTDACIDTFVAVPCVGLKVTGPSQSGTNEELVFRIEISNECEEDLTGMKLEVNFDEGFEAPNQVSPMTYGPITEPIRFGETKVVEMTLIPKQAGTRCFNLNVTTDRGDTATGQKCVEVTALPEPDVEIAISGPTKGDVGKTATYDVTVTNTGNVTLKGLQISALFSDSLEPNFATRGYVWENDGLAWRYQQLAPGDTINLKIVDNMVAADPEAITLVKVVTAEGVSDRDQARTFIQSAETPDGGQVDGGGNQTRIPAEAAGNRLRVSVATLDAVRVGQIARMQVVVRNDRAIPDQDVSIAIEVPAGMEYAGSNDVREASRSADGSRILLVPFREMRAGDETRFVIQMRALRPGTFPIKVFANSTLSDGAVEGGDNVEVTQ